ncbi:MAG: glycosyl hydrolase [Candidatus Aminicenantales bacterium]
MAVLAFPTLPVSQTIPLIEEKALYYRAPYTSQPGVLPYLAAPGAFAEISGVAVEQGSIIDLTARLRPDGSLDWDVPPGDWTIMRFVSRNNGAVTRSAPLPGLGFECDKFDADAFDAHYEAYVGELLRKVRPRLEGKDVLPDKRAYSFDGCSADNLMKRASVVGGRIVFPGGASYRILILPAIDTMTPELLAKIEALVKEGAVVVGGPPRKSPSLENYPGCDRRRLGNGRDALGKPGEAFECRRARLRPGKDFLGWCAGSGAPGPSGEPFDRCHLPGLYGHIRAPREARNSTEFFLFRRHPLHSPEAPRS